MQRIPLEITVFEDMEIPKRYDKETEMWMRYVSKSFASILRRWGVTSGKILDVGTGTGSLAIELAKSFPRVGVVGLDLSDVVLQLARENAQEGEVSSRVAFEHGEAEGMPSEDKTFDLMISSSTLHLMKNPITIFDEMQRVLKLTGKFFISELRRSWLGILTPHIRTSYSPKEVESLLSQSKLQGWQVNDSLLWLSIQSKS